MTNPTPAPTHVPSQKEMILQHLRQFGSIEPLTALREYGCYRLGARIADLREDGYHIQTTKIAATSKITGRPLMFARYTLLDTTPQPHTQA